jgi:hypothetical protein
VIEEALGWEDRGTTYAMEFVDVAQDEEALALRP